MNIRTVGGVLRQTIVPLTVAVVLSVSTYSLTASNTVPVTRAGSGAEQVTGYTVSNVHYNLNANDPRNVDSVSFTLDAAPPAGATIKAKLQAASTTWYTCAASGADVTCNTSSPQATAAGADELSVVIGQ